MAHRLLELQVKGPFGSEAVVLSISGREQISRPFEFHVELVSTELTLKPADVIGVPICVRLDRGEVDVPRYFHGYVSHMSAGDTTENIGDKKMSYRNYRVRLVPWLWFLSRAARCFVFHPEKETKSVMECLEKAIERVKKELHVDPKWEDKTDGLLDAPQVEHCVQYRETDFNFLSRMLEQYGVSYYFTHKENEHKMVWSSASSFEPAVESSVKYPSSAGTQTQEDHLLSWEHHYEFVSGKYMLNAYNFKTPSEDIKADKAQSVALGNNTGYELYDYSGEYDKKGDGTKLANFRILEEQTRFNTVSASSQCKTFLAGATFKIASHPSNADEVGKQYLITSISHSASQPAPISSGGNAASYSNRFEAQIKDVPFVPPRLTARPLVSGIQTATVAGPSGEEIHVDEHGRVKIHYHWDREGREKRFEEGQKLFSWVRVAMPIAGKSWGMMAIPRVGQEVVVNFLDGDPDQPLIVGSVYNAEQTPHYSLPDDKTKSYIKTNSSPGGDGYNELMFEDKASEERVFMHAQRDLDVRALNDAKYRVLANQHEIIGASKTKSDAGDLTQLVWRDKILTVKRDQAEHIGGDFQLLIGKGEDGGRADIVIDKQEVKKVGAGGTHLTVEGPSKNEIGENYSTKVGGDVHLKAGGAIQIEAGPMGEVHIKANTIILEAMMQISFKVGPNFIDISPAAISIQGMITNINSGGAPGQGQSCQPEKPEAAIEAKPAEPAEAWDSKTGSKSRP